MRARRRVVPHLATTARRRAVTLAVLVAVAGAHPVAAAPRAARAYGVTTFTATTSGVVTFTLAKPTPFRLSNSLTVPEIAISGGGRMAGIVIAQEGITTQRGAAIFALRFNGCWDRACSTPAEERLFPQMYGGSVGTADVPHGDGSKTMTLPAGRYKAYVVADGTPVRVAVRFTGASGAARLSTTPRPVATLTSAPNAFANQPFSPHALYSAGASGTVTAPIGLLAAVVGARSVMHASTAAGACYYTNDQQPPDGRFLPGCPGGTGSPMIVVNGVAPFHHAFETAAFVSGPRVWTQGVYVDGVDAREWVSPTALLWLSLS